MVTNILKILVISMANADICFMNQTLKGNEAKAWLKRDKGPDEIIRVIPAENAYDLYTAFDSHPDHLGRILFDTEGYWIYDGDVLSVNEQEQLARFITGYTERL